MQILHRIPDLAKVPGPVHLAIGVFDGIHLGHQAVIAAATQAARQSAGSAVVLTFHPHPMRVLRPEAAPRLLTSTRHKEQLIGTLGVQALLIQEFTLGFSQTRPEEFVRVLVESARPLRQICVGKGWTFGANRSGNISTLDSLARAHGFTLTEVPAVAVDGQAVSSTIIRAVVQRGDLALAGRLLGRPFTILGTVAEGNQLGRQLGFPTANLRAHNEQFPPDGVYAARARYAGQEYGGVVNIGLRPTLERPGERLLELHLFDFDRQIYGEDVEVEFLVFLRPEQKFNSLTDLVKQIERDVIRARAVYRDRVTTPNCDSMPLSKRPVTGW